MMDNYYVYCHISPSNKMYIGITNNPRRRWLKGEGYKHNYHFYRAIKKYGWDAFQHLILFSGLSKEMASMIEKELIAKFNLVDRKHGYNLIISPDGPFSDDTQTKKSEGQKNRVHEGHPISEEQKQKISNTLKEYYKTHDNPFKNKHHSEETKNKLRNKVVSEETKQKMRENHYDCSGAKNPSSKSVVQLSKDGKIIQVYPYAKMAAQSLHVDLSSLIKCCRGKHKTCGGYVWKYYEDKEVEVS